VDAIIAQDMSPGAHFRKLQEMGVEATTDLQTILKDDNVPSSSSPLQTSRTTT